MRVLVTGASGLIGSALCERLLSRADEVVGLSRDPAMARATNPEVAWHAWDAVGEPAPGQALEGCDAVVNLIGESISQIWTAGARRRILESREIGTRNLVAGMRAVEPRPGVLVSGSAIGYYGGRGDEVITEDFPPAERFDSRVCVAWEREAGAAEELGVRLAIMRTGIVLARRGALKQMAIPFRFGLGGPLGSGRQFMPWIHMTDEVGLLVWALDSAEASGAINAVAPNPVTNREFSKTLARVLRRPSFARVPGFVLRLGGEMGQLLLDSQRIVPARALELGYEFRYPELEPALADLLNESG